MSSELVSGSTCASAGGHSVKLLSVPLTGTATVRLLGPSSGILTHWTGKRPKACPGANLCPPSDHRKGTIWKGYAPAELWQESPQRLWVPCVLEITERLWELLADSKLRGQVWELRRSPGDSGRPEVTGRLVDLVDPRVLRNDVQIQPVVCRVYRTVEIMWDCKPILPQRQVLVASTNDPPPNATPGTEAKDIPGTPEWEADRAAVRAKLAELLHRPGANGGRTKERGK